MIRLIIHTHNDHTDLRFGDVPILKLKLMKSSFLKRINLT